MCLEKRVSNIPTEWLVKIINKTAIKSDIPTKDKNVYAKCLVQLLHFPNKTPKIPLSKMFNLHHSTVVPNFIWFGTRLCHLLRRKFHNFHLGNDILQSAFHAILRPHVFKHFRSTNRKQIRAQKESWQAWKEPKNCILPFIFKGCSLSLSQSKVNNVAMAFLAARDKKYLQCVNAITSAETSFCHFYNLILSNQR